jgi:hypothetical protein
VEQPAAIDNPSFWGARKRSPQGPGVESVAVGNCSFSSALHPSQRETICNPYDALPMNEVDAALIGIDKSVPSELEVMDIGPLTGTTRRADLTPSQTVEIAGKSSGNRRLAIGGLAHVSIQIPQWRVLLFQESL